MEQLQEIIEEYTRENQALSYQVDSLQETQSIFHRQLKEKDQFIETLKANYEAQRDSFERALKEQQESCIAQRGSFERALNEQQGEFRQALSEKMLLFPL